MALLGKAALAMWWDMAPEIRPDFEDWHSHEHFPERLAIPGFLRASRWRSEAGGEGFFVMYELQDHAVLSSGPYLARLNSPSPWSTRLMPHHRNMVRTQCRVLASAGGMVGAHAMTIRLTRGSAAPAQDELGAGAAAELSAACATLAMLPGLVGVHVLRHEQPAIAPTTEQRIRGLADQAADWVVVACGYEAEAVAAVLRHEALQAIVARNGAGEATPHGYRLCYSAVAADVADVAADAAAHAPAHRTSDAAAA